MQGQHGQRVKHGGGGGTKLGGETESNGKRGRIRGFAASDVQVGARRWDGDGENVRG